MNFRSNPALNAPLNLGNPDVTSIQLAIAMATNEIRKDNGLPEFKDCSPTGERSANAC